MSGKSWDHYVGSLRRTLGDLPDKRTGDNTQYSMEDIGLSAFSVFFTQSPSFLSTQKTLEQNKGCSNAKSLFQIQKIPCDNHIRDCLDSVAPEQLFPLYDEVYQDLRRQGRLESMRAFHQTQLIALDGTWYFSSDKIHCPQCSCLEHKSGKKTYYHSAITPVIVAPGQPQVVALRPEFMVPQDGHNKQDCEIAAAKRWLQSSVASLIRCSLLGLTISKMNVQTNHAPIQRVFKKQAFYGLLRCHQIRHHPRQFRSIRSTASAGLGSAKLFVRRGPAGTSVGALSLAVNGTLTGV